MPQNIIVPQLTKQTSEIFSKDITFDINLKQFTPLIKNFDLIKPADRKISLILFKATQMIGNNN